MPASSAAPSCFEPGVGVAGGQFFQGRDARRHRHGIAAQRARLVHRAERRQEIHDVRAPAKRAHRQAAADDFAEATQVRRDAEPLLRAALGQAEAGHHLVENQQRAVGLGDLAEEFQIARLRQIQPGVARHRLDDDAGDLIFVRGEGRLHRLSVVERQDDGVLRERRRHARRCRDCRTSARRSRP